MPTVMVMHRVRSVGYSFVIYVVVNSVRPCAMFPIQKYKRAPLSFNKKKCKRKMLHRRQLAVVPITTRKMLIDGNSTAGTQANACAGGK
jgi:hypothetical protein